MLEWFKTFGRETKNENDVEMGTAESINSTATNNRDNSPEKKKKDPTTPPEVNQNKNQWIAKIGEYGSLSATVAGGVLGLLLPNSSTAGLYISASTALSFANMSQALKLFATNHLLKQAHTLLFAGLVEINHRIKIKSEHGNESAMVEKLKILADNVANIVVAAKKIEAQNATKLILDTIHVLAFFARMIMLSQEPNSKKDTDPDAHHDFIQASQYFDLVLCITSTLLLMAGYFNEKKTNNVMSHTETALAKEQQTHDLGTAQMVDRYDSEQHLTPTDNAVDNNNNNNNVAVEEKITATTTRPRIAANMTQAQIALLMDELAQQQVLHASNNQDATVLNTIINNRPTSAAPSRPVVNRYAWVPAPNFRPPRPPQNESSSDINLSLQ